MIIKTYNKQYTEKIEMLDNIIRKYSFASNGFYLLKIEKAIDWDEMTNFIFENLGEINRWEFEKKIIPPLIKSLVLGKIFQFPDNRIPTEIMNNKAFMSFIGVEKVENIPGIKIISSFLKELNGKGINDYIFENFYNQLNSKDLDIINNQDIDKKQNLKSLVSTNDLETNNNLKLKIDDLLYVKMFDLFFDSLDSTKTDKTVIDKEIKDHQLTKEQKYVSEIIKEVKKKIYTYDENLIDNIHTGPENKSLKINDEHIEFRPNRKTESIFNDENLTEDYELGYRFHQLGLKMGFFNVKLDNNNESSRISTAEFFPNTFWSSVKQRSRWIAGICLQNWKAHQWKGNLTMKYFLFRDRKPLFSLFGAFFSNVIVFYLIYAIVTNLVFGGNKVYLVSHSSVLWYIMAANVIFMVSRASHRFIFTYNWYGFKYAFFSFFRLLVDTAINFFAVIRSISVYRKSKEKVVWDSTLHY